MDLLDAEKEVFDAEVNLISAQRDVIVFSYGLLGVLGRLNAETLKLPVKLFDPTEDFERQKFNFYTTTVD